MGKGKKKRMAKADRAAVTKAAKAIKVAKPRNPQDATLRNTRAAAARMDDIKGMLSVIQAQLDRMAEGIKQQSDRLAALEAQAPSAAPAPLIPAP